MQIGLVSDVHGNGPALRAVESDMPDVDRVVCAGDVVGYNPWPADCLEWVRDRATSVQGNHDRAVAADTAFRFNSMAQAGVEYAREQLSDDQLRWLGDLPERTTVADGRVRVAHGHPDDPDRYTYPDEFAPELLDGEDVLVLGHTHVQGVREFEEGVVVNPGSVGQPRDGDPRAAYAVLDLSGWPTVETHRVEYDLDRVQQRVREVGLPGRIGTRLERGE